MSNGTFTQEDVSRARTFALRAHAEQRYGDQPYSVHLDAVAELLEPYGPLAQAIGYLHDVVEDTSISGEEIQKEFGDLPARCVLLVTDSPGTDRAERKQATNDKLIKVDGEERIALIVKAADRLANVRASALSGNDAKLAMYRSEHAAFREAAYRPRLCDPLWEAMGLILSKRE
jgi:guanosine-3',5'-bis(diphosphate) 3'-pyrophosphohydrolase